MTDKLKIPSFALLVLCLLGIGCNTFGEIDAATSSTAGSNNTTSNPNNATSGSNNSTNTNGTNNANSFCRPGAPADVAYTAMNVGGYERSATCSQAAMLEAQRFSAGSEAGPIDDAGLATTSNGVVGYWLNTNQLFVSEYNLTDAPTPVVVMEDDLPAQIGEIHVFNSAPNNPALASIASDCKVAVDTAVEDGTQGVSNLACPSQNKRFGLGHAGGWNAYSQDNDDFFVTLFEGDRSRAYEPASGTLNLVAAPKVNPAPFDRAFVESTSGSVFGFLNQDGVFQLRSARSLRDPLSMEGTYEPGQVSLIHLAQEHYVLATASGDSVSLKMFEAQGNLDDVWSVVWGPETIVNTGGDLHWIKLTAMPGGLALFYDQGASAPDRKWTIVPIAVIAVGAVETLVCRDGLTHNYQQDIVYQDVLMTVVTDDCSASVVLLRSFTNDNNNMFVHIEGATFPGFYGQ